MRSTPFKKRIMRDQPANIAASFACISIKRLIDCVSCAINKQNRLFFFFGNTVLTWSE